MIVSASNAANPVAPMPIQNTNARQELEKEIVTDDPFLTEKRQTTRRSNILAATRVSRSGGSG
jgi:hypothetical protein